MRYAVYYAPPPGSVLATLGAQWLGRDAHGGKSTSHPDGSLIGEVTAEPRRYGLHATLKPPFALRLGSTASALAAAVEHLASSLIPTVIDRLMLRQIDGFLALVPSHNTQSLGELAETCVRHLDGFRQPAGEAELARRRDAGLTPRQEENLRRWGYPYVMEEFRFHITLTRRLTQEEARQIVPSAEAHFEPVLGQPLAVNALTVFCEHVPGADFTAGQRFAMEALESASA